ELRIKDKRRIQALTSMKMLTNATLFHGYQCGPGDPTIDDLAATDSVRLSDLYDPEGGRVFADAAGAGRTTAYGTQAFLTPLIEIDAGMATSRERDEYGRFRNRYSSYWRRFFDPIGVRVSVGKTIRLETCILPLIDLSRYNELKDIAGGEPISVDVDRFADKTLVRFVMKFDDGPRKEGILSIASTTMDSLSVGTNVTTDWVGNWLTFWIEDTDALFQLLKNQSRDSDEAVVNHNDAIIDFFNATFVAGIHVTNKVSLAAFLVAARVTVQKIAPNTVVFQNMDPYRGVTIVRIAPDPSSGLERDLRPEGRPKPEPDGPAVYYATIADGFYISTQESALKSLIDRAAEPVELGPGAPQPIRANVLLYADPAAADLIRPTVGYWLEQQAFGVSQRNLVQIQMLGRCGVLEGRSLDQAARKFLGYRIECPDGGSYRYEAASNKAVCSVHGSIYEPTRPSEPPDGSPLKRLLDSIETLTAALRFTPEGLESTVEIARREAPR
ncbi:MAG: hypothetical protein O7B26_10750, partial [Planctomycetota bacterium]|nr:hypothetical protein [Planctomycetota bacterium]